MNNTEKKKSLIDCFDFLCSSVHILRGIRKLRKNCYSAECFIEEKLYVYPKIAVRFYIYFVWFSLVRRRWWWLIWMFRKYCITQNWWTEFHVQWIIHFIWFAKYSQIRVPFIFIAYLNATRVHQSLSVYFVEREKSVSQVSSIYNFTWCFILRRFISMKKKN